MTNNQYSMMNKNVGQDLFLSMRNLSDQKHVCCFFYCISP